jgi:hypothetical protein
VIKEFVEEIAGREAKFVLEEGREHHNLSRIGCRNVFPDGRMPLQDGAVQEKVIPNKLVDFTFIRERRLEMMWVRGGHRGGERSQQHRIRASARVEIARNGGKRSD